ncbi:hypothetical protein [Hymenobacter cheonanensis]|uniref:hypothetical protein n=1 Tax=Hymenobacter sp. CA2-7 TaxID=3063993 RepID=UPI0027126183|nr:hypothetical protein [Hymenobacter sp. CA2-7]MDO7886467.1 hypothetical protein [Hymenobacter sp. CA2-7]
MTNDTPNQDWISQAEAARRKGVSRQAINKLVKAGRLKTLEIGGSVFVSSEQVSQYTPAPKGRKKRI